MQCRNLLLFWLLISAQPACRIAFCKEIFRFVSILYDNTSSLRRKKCWIWFCILSPQHLPASAQSAICFFNFPFAKYFNWSWFAFSTFKFPIPILQNVLLDPDLRFQSSNFQFLFCRMFRLILFATLLSLVVGQCEVSVKNVGVVRIVNYLSHYKRNIWLQNCPNTFNFVEIRSIISSDF